MLLAPAAKGPPPEPKRAVPERREAFEVSWYCVVVEVTLHDRFEPFASSRHGIVHARVELLLDLSQLGPHALADRLASHGKSNVSGLSSALRFRFSSANRPNSIRRVFSGWSSSPNFANRSRKFSRKRSASV